MIKEILEGKKVRDIMLAEAETFKCPTCGTNVLKNTKYCVKCKKKVSGDSDA